MISVVIPTFNEEARLSDLLAQLVQSNTNHEIIVADGGSSDETIAIARSLGARVVQAKKGRGIQLAEGAQAATGKILLFLHADSVLPPGGLDSIEREMGSSNMVGGNFRLEFDGDTGFSRWLTGFYAWIRKRGLYYGDSGIFVLRSVYEELGGIKPLALMEDYDFSRRLERSGRTCCIDDPPLITSSRKFAGRSAVGIVWGWLKIHALYHLGVSPDRLARIYYGREKIV